MNSNKLEKFYHVDQLPQRAPVIISFENGGFSCPEIIKFGKKVKYDSPSKAHLIITQLEILDQSATIEFNYKPEGILGRIKFKKANSAWNIHDSEIVEK